MNYLRRVFIYRIFERKTPHIAWTRSKANTRVSHAASLPVYNSIMVYVGINTNVQYWTAFMDYGQRFLLRCNKNKFRYKYIQ